MFEHSFHRKGATPENSSAVEDISLHTEEAGLDWLCSAPGCGDWVIDTNCTIDDTQDAPGNVEIPSPHKVNVTATGALTVDFTSFHLLVKAGAKVLVDALATIG
ncbi:MAG: hypothetical protein SVY41_02915 [Candidatus Nanohaloarchaea archaeon]|nr:hypothetical protein [Candidatus Nanohaloarchaea archaeon]